jgi:nuclear transport factor 2 (NTF2) superfamily protein
MTDLISLEESAITAPGHWREVAFEFARKKPRKYFSYRYSDDEGSWDFRSDGEDSWDSQATVDFESERKMVKKRVTKVKQWLTAQDHEEEPVGPC